MSDDTQTNSASATADPATLRVDVQDPLPETNWFWRRVYTFALSLISVAFIWFGVEALYDMRQPQHVFSVTRYMIGVHVLLITYYMLAPSAEQMVKLIQSARLLRSGVPITRSAVVETPQGGRTEVRTTAGAPEALPPQNRSPAPLAGDEEDFAPRSRS
jgi:predicted amidohydrolase